MKYQIEINGQYMIFIRDAGKCYGGVRTITLDMTGLTGKKLYRHIKTYIGDSAAKAAKEQGRCD